MSSHNFGAFIQHESSPAPTINELARVVRRDEVISTSPSAMELDDLQWGKRLNGPPSPDQHGEEINDQTNPTPRELEQSRPSTPKENQAVDAVVQSISNPPRNRWRLASTGLMFMLIGMNDSVVRFWHKVERRSSALNLSDRSLDSLH